MEGKRECHATKLAAKRRPDADDLQDHIRPCKKLLRTGQKLDPQEVLQGRPAGGTEKAAALVSTPPQEDQTQAIYELLTSVCDHVFCPKKDILRLCNALAIGLLHEISYETLPMVVKILEKKEHLKQARVSASISGAFASDKHEDMRDALRFITRQLNCTTECKMCGEEVPADAMQEHNEKCTGRKAPCLFNFASGQKHISCNWSGPTDAMRKHVEKMHPTFDMPVVQLKRLGEEARVVLPSLNRAIVINGKVNYGAWWASPFMVEYEGLTFMMVNYMGIRKDGKLCTAEVAFGVDEKNIAVGHYFKDTNDRIFCSYDNHPSKLRDFDVTKGNLLTLLKPHEGQPPLDVPELWKQHADFFRKVEDRKKDDNRAVKYECLLSLNLQKHEKVRAQKPS
jgi:hypothetical protein